MFVLHVNQSDSHGGAAISARRLVAAEREAGIDARLLVLKKTRRENFVDLVPSRLIRAKARTGRFVARRISRWMASSWPDTMRTLAFVNTGLAAHIRDLAPAIVHWHWIGGEIISALEISRLRIPSAWTCHDQWIFRGAEHLALNNDFIDDYRDAGFLDIDAWVHRRKKTLWHTWSPELICPSRWVEEDALKSPIAESWSKHVIGNTLDFEKFRPLVRAEVRAKFGISNEKIVLAFGSHYGAGDYFKGFDLLEEVLLQLERSFASRCVLLIFGNEKPARNKIQDIPVVFSGYLADEVDLAEVYSAADVFVSTSRQETFGNTVLEALACGTPCVTFDIGGLRDLVSQNLHGARISNFNTELFANTLAKIRCNQNENDRQKRHDDMRMKYAPKTIAAAHLKLYEAMLRT